MNTVRVNTITYKGFINRYRNILIPEYQRPYGWDEDKIKDLLSDLKEFFIDKPATGLDYYMGGILLFHNKKKNCFEVIDGQQRLTTLHLMSYLLSGNIEDGQNFQYNNHLSWFYIKQNFTYLKKHVELLNELHEKSFFGKLVFTLIISPNEDKSFSFFDSQNSRGVSLAADDYLKAYHLREVHSEKLQSKLAEQWEQTAIKAQSAMDKESGLLHLFYKILYRSRQWKGQSLIMPESKDQILASFQKSTLPSGGNTYRLFRARDNIRFSEVEINEKDIIKPKSADVTWFANTEKLPFSIRQPLYKGLNFFQYTQKYHAVHQLLFYQNNLQDKELIKCRKFYEFVYNTDMSEYLRHYMQLCLVMYYDSFGTIAIFKAVQYFDYFIGSIRISKYYVRQEAIKNSLMQSGNNLLDVIAQAYLPEEVSGFITTQLNIKSIYENENLPVDEGVRSKYKNRVLEFYKQNASRLTNRLEWIK